MSHSGNFTAVLDACVLYPASLRDLLLTLAAKKLYRPCWSAEIQEEWTRSLVKDRTDIPAEVLQRTIEQMNKAFKDAQIKDFQKIQAGLNLPDTNDAHVLAAAIKAKADVIVTSNLSDFPSDYISIYNIKAVDPDTFIVNIIDLDEELALKALHELSARLQKPPKSPEDILDTLEKNGLEKSATRFRELLQK